jgi:secreted trypsin-like serine protease
VLRDRNGKILTGEDAQPQEFPWMVSIKAGAGQHVCGGFVINNRHIISAAHCFRQKYNGYLEYNQDGYENILRMRHSKRGRHRRIYDLAHISYPCVSWICKEILYRINILSQVMWMNGMSYSNPYKGRV